MSDSTGKGDSRRPYIQELYDAGYDIAFAKNPEDRAAAQWRLKKLEAKRKDQHASD